MKRIDIISKGKDHLELWKNSTFRARLRIINQIPVIVFISDIPAESFFVHINTKGEDKDYQDWTTEDIIHFSLTLKSEGKVLSQKTVILSEDDTTMLKVALVNQADLTEEQIEESVAYLYESDFVEHNRVSKWAL